MDYLHFLFHFGKSSEMFKIALLVLLAAVTARGQSSSIKCEADELPCYNYQCIERFRWCDTAVDCRDGSDERYCRRGLSPRLDPNHCKSNPFFFLCIDGTCIPRDGLCDGYEDCPDSSDETNCTEIPYIYNNTIEFSDFSLPDPPKMDRDLNRPLRLYRYVDESSSYEDLPYRSYEFQLNSARTWLKSQQKEDYGWGDYTARAVIAMYLSKETTTPKSEDDLLMEKQLDIELSIALTRNDTNRLSLSELAIYINALLASCKNPRNFYGYDLVNILRERTNIVHSSGKFVSPFVHLALCLSNTTDFGDVRSIQESLRIKQNTEKVDIVSLAVLASSCIIKTPLFNHNQYRRNIVEILLNKIKKSGLPKNIYELALVMQALNEAKVDPHEWERKEAIDFILETQDKNGSFGDILATYYTIPILSGRSLLSLSDHCDKDFSNGKVPLAILKNAKRRKITVHYSLCFGEPVELTQKVQLQVGEGTNFLDIMRLAEEENPNFRFNLDETKAVPFVYSIGGIPNDAECGLYWTLHIQNARNTSHFIPYVKDIKDLVPSDGEEMRFYLKQM